MAPLTGPAAVGVVVPARDEEELLPACLAALAVAASRLVLRYPWLMPDVVVVLDGCTDSSADVVAAAQWPDGLPRPRPLVITGRGVGAARAAGVSAVAQRLFTPTDRPVEAGRLWLATTDADSAVPPGWLLDQVRAARRGVIARVGVVRLDDAVSVGRETFADKDIRRRWAAAQHHVEGHRHVHGANLGVRYGAYLAAGGFASVATGEDIGLVRRLGLLPGALLWTARHPVTTSARLQARAPGGVARDLRALSVVTG